MDAADQLMTKSATAIHPTTKNKALLRRLLALLLIAVFSQQLPGG